MVVRGPQVSKYHYVSPKSLPQNHSGQKKSSSVEPENAALKKFVLIAITFSISNTSRENRYQLSIDALK